MCAYSEITVIYKLLGISEQNVILKWVLHSEMTASYSQPANGKSKCAALKQSQ